MSEIHWNNVGGISSLEYICWNCGRELASDKGWSAINRNSGQWEASICICHRCSMPTLVMLGKQVPGVRYGSHVHDISDESVQELYEEARSVMQVSGHTSAVLACRKLLMHIAVSKGAKPGESFAAYVDFLVKNHYVPPDAKGWVDHIRKLGNEANHEIRIVTRDDAEELIKFTEMLLKLIFEFPAAMNRKGENENGTT